MNKKIKVSIPSLDKFFEGGMPAGKISILMGETVPKTPFFFKAWPTVNEQRMISFNLENSEMITKHGQCIIDEMLKKMKEEGIDTSKVRKCTYKMEKIGDTIFPVRYYEDGSVIIDYPSKI
jgi:hypothetical protein